MSCEPQGRAVPCSVGLSKLVLFLRKDRCLCVLRETCYLSDKPTGTAQSCRRRVAGRARELPSGGLSRLA